jgi:hypothetical protein
MVVFRNSSLAITRAHGRAQITSIYKSRSFGTGPSPSRDTVPATVV